MWHFVSQTIKGSSRTLSQLQGQLLDIQGKRQGINQQDKGFELRINVTAIYYDDVSTI